MILVDAGPLVALFHYDDRNHTRCLEALNGMREPLVTVWSVVTEVVHLLGFQWTRRMPCEKCSRPNDYGSCRWTSAMRRG